MKVYNKPCAIIQLNASDQIALDAVQRYFTLLYNEAWERRNLWLTHIVGTTAGPLSFFFFLDYNVDFLERF